MALCAPSAEHNVVRFGPEFKQYYTKTLDFHLDGDVGIGDLVYANTYWAQDDKWVNEYSEYMQYVNVNANPPNTNFNAVDAAGVHLPHRPAVHAPDWLIPRDRTAAAAHRFSTTTTLSTSTAGRTNCGCNRRRADCVPLADRRLLGEDPRHLQQLLRICPL